LQQFNQLFSAASIKRVTVMKMNKPLMFSHCDYESLKSATKKGLKLMVRAFFSCWLAEREKH
jgi:hypothetical protein